jgi:mono/diheme cytochrome c family protein
MPRLSFLHWRIAAMIGPAVLAPALWAQSGAANAAAPVATADSSRALVNEYCLSCHSKEMATAGVVLEDVDFTRVPNSASVLERVLRKIRGGEMPPPGMPRPPAPVAAAFANWLEKQLDQAAAANPNPGRPAAHRLNRAEYSNAIRDLLALDTHPGDQLPADDSGYGFDNIGDLLTISPALVERYLLVGRQISRLAVGDLSLQPEPQIFNAPHDPDERAHGARNERVSDDLPFDSRGGMSFEYYFPLDAEYVIRMKSSGTAVADPTADGDAAAGPKPSEVRLTLKAGPHTIGVDFPRESSKAEAEPAAGGRGFGGGGGGRGGAGISQTFAMELRLDGARIEQFKVLGGAAPELESVTVTGPYKSTGRGDTPSRAKIFVCRPASPKDEGPCARTILSNLARHAFRRPVTDADLRPLLAFYETGRKNGDFDFGIEKALEAIVISPDFLFRVEQDPVGIGPGKPYRISDLELASRLSFFLWSSSPDDQLLSLAEKGKLKDPAVLEQQTRRMLDDARSQALVTNFAGQWLYLRNIGEKKVDSAAFPSFDESLRQSMQQETELFFQYILRTDRSVLDLLDANYTFLNQRLAEHYGIPNVYGSQFRKVTLTDPQRSGGLLGQASILTLTSYPNRTSVVQRGKWVLENLLGTPPPPPPPNVPELKPTGNDGKTLTIRQAMEKHRANAVCASCHSRMDPLGFALENYDGIGQWRSTDAGAPIDSLGKLPDGTQFSGLTGLSKLLATKYRDDFVRTATQKLLTYALGRGLDYYDNPTIRSISRDAARDDYRMSAMVLAIVKSTPFQMRRSPDK